MTITKARLPRRLVEVAPDETIVEASRTFKAVQLRLLMKEREDEVMRLVNLDYTIWVLEEYLRGKAP